MDNSEPTDDLLVGVYIKIRSKIAEVNKEYEDRLGHLRGQQKQVSAEILRRLHERGSTQTKTDSGTAFINEDVSITIADEEAYGAFVLAEQDPSYYQKRAKVERVKEYMKAHDGTLPPGLNIFRELVINVRAPKKKGAASDPASDDGRAVEHPPE
jgi:hypothetical protein